MDMKYDKMIAVNKAESEQKIKKAIRAIDDMGARGLPISVTEMPEDKVEIQTEFVKTIYRRILPDMETALQLHTTVHSLSAPPDKVQNYKCDT